ncbi:MAG TPA: hypothetical protein VGG33_16365, partial [Polyangia bacterium]
MSNGDERAFSLREGRVPIGSNALVGAVDAQLAAIFSNQGLESKAPTAYTSPAAPTGVLVIRSRAWRR